MVAVNSAANVLLGGDHHALWSRVNDTAVEVPEASVAELVLRHAQADPDRPAVLAARRQLTYRDLVAQASALAVTIDERSAGAPVVICVEPGWEQTVALLAGLMSRSPVHPVHPGLTQSVRWRRLADVDAKLVLTQSWLDERMAWPATTSRVAIDKGDGSAAVVAERASVGSRVACVLLADDPSGELLSVTDRALMDNVLALGRLLDIEPTDKVLCISPLDDQLALCSIVWALTNGASVTIPDDIDLRSTAAWATTMFRDDITLWAGPPALASMLVEHLTQRGEGVPPSLRLVAFAGEPLVPSLVSRLRSLSAHPLRVVNLGGMLAAGLWACAHEVEAVDPRLKHVPIGAPLSNRRVYVLNDAMEPCPVWVTGRLYFGSEDPPATRWRDGAELACDATVLPGSGGLAHRSPLVGRLLPNGTIDVVGDDSSRLVVHDHSRNLRDVEGVLAGHEAVLCSAVVPDRHEGSVAYVKLAPAASATGTDLMDHLRSRMSALVLPDRVELMASMPLTSAGKVDRAALVDAAAASVTPDRTTLAATVVDDEGLTERACALAARVLGVADVEATMNLLDLGATSVQLVRLAVQAEQELGIRVDVEQLLRFPAVTILVSAATVVAEEEEAPAGAPSDAAPAGAPSDAAPDVGRQAPYDAVVPPGADLVLDPVARMQFKARQPGLRRDLDPAGGVDLVRPTGDRDRLLRRHTQREFGQEPVSADSLGQLLAVLRQFRSGVEPKYAYPSAGSLYPIQTYVSIVEPRVEGICAGVYYYHPVRHRLFNVSPEVAVPAEAHAWINRDTFRSSAFTIYLVARMDSILPMYGDRARDYCLLEAGSMCQLLMSAATDIGLGLCPVGEMDFSRVRGWFQLDEADDLMHALIGGRLPADDGARTAEQEMLTRLASETRFAPPQERLR